MCATSINTFCRAFSVPPGGNIAKAAGNYTNTACTKNTKIILGLLSFGLLYGLAVLIEQFANVRPKIKEFAGLNCALYNAVVDRAPDSNFVSIPIGNNKNLYFYENNGMIHIDDGVNAKELPFRTFDELLYKIHQDAIENPDIYSGLNFTPTIGASMKLASASAGLRGNVKVLQKIQLELYSVRQPLSRQAYLDTLAGKFAELVGEKLSSNRTSDLSRSDLISGGISGAVVSHSPIIDSFGIFAAAAYPSS